MIGLAPSPLSRSPARPPAPTPLVLCLHTAAAAIVIFFFFFMRGPRLDIKGPIIARLLYTYEVTIISRCRPSLCLSLSGDGILDGGGG